MSEFHPHTLPTECGLAMADCGAELRFHTASVGSCRHAASGVDRCYSNPRLLATSRDTLRPATRPPALLTLSRPTRCLRDAARCGIKVSCAWAAAGRTCERLRSFLKRGDKMGTSTSMVAQALDPARTSRSVAPVHHRCDRDAPIQRNGWFQL